MAVDAQKAKSKVVVERRKRRIDYLNRRVAELHNQGIMGRKARDQADAEFRKAEGG